jgi:DNA primase
MTKVLSDFGIPEADLQAVVFSTFGQALTNTKEKIQQRKIEPNEIPTPKTFYFLKDAKPTDEWATIAKEYLRHERCINWDDYPFMLAKKTADPTMRKWFKRLIIPIYKQKKLVFYQGRDLTDKAKQKYQSAKTETSRVIYGFDHIFQYESTAPLYIVEGWFDAFLINGIAVLGNSISEEQATWIDKSNRLKVFVPDRFGNGKEVAFHALELGWSISTPDFRIDESCKDINDVVKRYGKLYTMKTLADNTTTGFGAETLLNLYCK